jgi:hypothetical protein
LAFHLYLPSFLFHFGGVNIS